MVVKRAKKTAGKASAPGRAKAPARKPVAKAGAKPAPRSTRPAAKSAVQSRPKPKDRAKAKAPAKVASATVPAKKPAKPAVPARPQGVPAIVISALEDMKAVNTTVLDVRGLTDIADTMIVATGNSDRHVRSIAARVIEYAKKAGFRPVGVEGERDGEWVLVDLQDVIVHVMLARVREFYRLEDLWDVSAAARDTAR